MNKELFNFEDYYQRKLVEVQQELTSLPYTKEEIREIIRQEWEWIRNAPELQLELKAQSVDNNTIQYYLPEKWEMPRKGKLLYSDEELQRVLKLLMFNLGVEKSLDIIPGKLIEQYLDNKVKQRNEE